MIRNSSSNSGNREQILKLGEDVTEHLRHLHEFLSSCRDKLNTRTCEQLCQSQTAKAMTVIYGMGTTPEGWRWANVKKN